MQVAVVGTGNVGSALLFHLVNVPAIESILVMNLRDEWSAAAIMDVVSAQPECAPRLVVAPFSHLGQADVIALTSGQQMKAGQTAADVRQANLELTGNILDSAPLKPTAVVIALATPVDDVTAFIQKRYALPECQVLGFGGDLDRNRLAYLLISRGIPADGIAVVGEHGKRTIPVYTGEADYAEVARRVRDFLGDITAHGGSPRNLATGLLMARLIDSIVNDVKRTHFVSGYHPAYRLYLTWPFQVGRKGILSPGAVRPGPGAQQELDDLIALKRSAA